MSDGYDQGALDAASREVHMMLLREGSSWGTKACEEMGRVFMTAYRKALPSATRRNYCEACGYIESHDPNCPAPKAEAVEPVAWMYEDTNPLHRRATGPFATVHRSPKSGWKETPLYAAPVSAPPEEGEPAEVEKLRTDLAEMTTARDAGKEALERTTAWYSGEVARLKEHIASLNSVNAKDKLYLAPLQMIGGKTAELQVRFVARDHIKNKPTEANPTPIRVLLVGDIEQAQPTGTAYAGSMRSDMNNGSIPK